MPTHRLEVTLQTITPLFMGGADPRGEPELRAASFRGALRFWLRALLGGVLGDDPQKVFEHESKVFGSIDDGASPIIIQIEHTQPQTISFLRIAAWNERRNSYEKPGIAYLFFSARGTRTTPDRKAIQANTTFRLTLRARAGAGLAGEEALRRAWAALWLLTRLGGIGSRARRGGGNLQIIDVQGESPSNVPNLPVQAQTPQQLRDELADGLRQLRALVSAGSPAPTTISATPNFDILHPNACRIVITNKTWNTWEQALDEVGRKFADFRHEHPPEHPAVVQIVAAAAGLGTDPTLSGVERAALSGVERAAFGLPLPFYFRSVQQALERQGVDRREAQRKAQAVVQPEREDHDRRASPLFIRVVRLANGQHTMVMTVFKAALLEGSEGLTLKQGRRVLATAPVPDLTLIDAFLSGLGISLLEVKNW